MTILIPAYNPDEKLADLVRELPDDMPVIIVNDGSSQESEPIFAKVQSLGATVLCHEVNRGKGAALRTGIAYVKEAGEKEGIITADADGQHSYDDILRIANVIKARPGTFVMGGRDFSKMPLRSKFGNSITTVVFRLATGIRIVDTQTGLRGIPASLFDRMLEVEGDRYEYEMNVLLRLNKWKVPYDEIKITTIYHENNKSSHFRPLFDGLKVFFQVLKYALSSFLCTIVDYIVFIILTSFFPIAPPVCYACARVVSAVLNYQINCRVVFKGRPSVKSALLYTALVLVIMVIGSLLMSYLTGHMINSIIAKMIVDCICFVISYVVQKRLVFKI